MHALKDESFPLFLSTVSAGFTSPADDYLDQSLDLNALMVRHPAATFFVRVQGDSMLGSGIHSGDILVVDRAIEPKEGNIVVASLDGAFTVKRLSFKNQMVLLLPENPDYAPIEVGQETDFRIFGVVTYVVHKTA